jgi:peptidoglycan hydrolase-like protein with peptidoglycan-binding domain
VRNQRANIADYAAALRRSATAFTTGLGTWKPGDPIPVMDPNKPDLSTIEGVQIALTKLGYGPGAIDGEDGPRMRAAVQKLQAEHQPDAGPVDSVAGPKTRATLAAAFAKVAPAC